MQYIWILMYWRADRFRRLIIEKAAACGLRSEYVSRLRHNSVRRFEDAPNDCRKIGLQFSLVIRF